MKEMALPPNGQVGEARISETAISGLDRIRSMRDTASTGFPFAVDQDSCKRLHVGGILQMSNTRMERVTNAAFVREARGRVLIAGLGMGYVLTQILPKKEVKEVVVIENSADVINLVQPHFHSQKLTVILGDIHIWRPLEAKYKLGHCVSHGECACTICAKRPFDVIYFDIWPSVSTDNLIEMTKLHHIFRKYLAPGGYMNSWSRQELRRMKRRGY